MARRDSVTDEEPLDVHELRIDFAKRSVRVRGEEVQTTYVEFEILTALATNPGRVWTRDMLLTRIWGDSAYRDPRTIDVHIRHLREKLELRRQGAGVPLHRARSRLPVPRHGGVTPLRSLTLRLALPFCAIVIAAIAIVYLARRAIARVQPARPAARHARASRRSGTAPAIRRALDASRRRQRPRRPACGAPTTTPARASRCWPSRAPTAAACASRCARTRTRSPRISDLQFGVAERAARSGRIERGTEAGDAGRVAEAAVPLRITPPRSQRAGIYYVAVFSQQLEDIQRGVELIRQRILVAGAIALALAILAGVLVRELGLAPRQADGARRAAGSPQGDFTARFDVSARDELGRLARTLDGMQRQLAELETARSRFIATASHELRTPIFSIGGFLELLEDEELDEETRVMFIRQVREQVDRLGRLATDLLDLSKLEAGSLELRPERTRPARDRPRRSPREFAPALAAHESHLELRLAATRRRGRLRPGAGGPDHAYPHRQRAEPHPGGHRRRGRCWAAATGGYAFP